jgi:hypothetical protein
MLYLQVPAGHDKPTRVQRIGQALGGSFERALCKLIRDLDTFGKICRWLEIDPGDFLGRPGHQSAVAPAETTISAHFKAEKLPEPETLNALARMLLLIVKSETSRRVEHDA